MDEAGNNADPGLQDEEFEPTAEMMVNDFDDERTLDEEEALEEAGEQQDELCDLEKEKEMPLELLLAKYGYNGEGGDGAEEEEEDVDEEGLSTSPEDTSTPEEKMEEDEEPLQEVVADLKINTPISVQQSVVEDKEKPATSSMLHELYKDDPSVTGRIRQLRSGSRPPSEDEEEEDDGEESPEEEEWKKTIMVGSDYQATIPEGLRYYGDAMPYENEDKRLWNPISISEADVAEYLRAVQELQSPTVKEVSSIPVGSHVRDDEQTLYLLQQCGHNVEEAMRRQNINSASPVDTMSLWSEEECRNFESGLRQYGKDFNLIQQNKVRTRSVSELVQFYYLWKKTERHDVFANKSKLEKKKYALHPGTTDYMERFLDEQESPVTMSNVHSLLSGDPKRQARTPPPVQSQVDTEVITADEARIINTHFEDIARHLDKESLESLVRLAAAARLPNGMPQSSASENVSVSVSRTSCVSTCDNNLVTHSSPHSSSFAQ